jgi:hypothetical protein
LQQNASGDAALNREPGDLTDEQVVYRRPVSRSPASSDMQAILILFAAGYLWIQFLRTREQVQREAQEVEEYERQWRAKHNIPKPD